MKTSIVATLVYSCLAVSTLPKYLGAQDTPLDLPPFTEFQAQAAYTCTFDDAVDLAPTLIVILETLFPSETADCDGVSLANCIEVGNLAMELDPVFRRAVVKRQTDSLECKLPHTPYLTQTIAQDTCCTSSHR
ncbi:hypothetical protein BDY21DRAFT_329914 [Lineolata rhizophorae]|uniref:Uncharacterized protein n=1 Tax=Lineolata rhizophorae TaxID=578093 RepID=A0A6A6PEQ5_9PEZI|nr:hypothetical protein BDY21DRAFT_329914 [Lineolata rhizophorae]